MSGSQYEHALALVVAPRCSARELLALRASSRALRSAIRFTDIVCATLSRGSLPDRRRVLERVRSSRRAASSLTSDAWRAIGSTARNCADVRARVGALDALAFRAPESLTSYVSSVLTHVMADDPSHPVAHAAGRSAETWACRFRASAPSLAPVLNALVRRCARSCFGLRVTLSECARTLLDLGAPLSSSTACSLFLMASEDVASVSLRLEYDDELGVRASVSAGVLHQAVRARHTRRAVETLTHVASALDAGFGALVDAFLTACRSTSVRSALRDAWARADPDATSEPFNRMWRVTLLNPGFEQCMSEVIERSFYYCLGVLSKQHRLLGAGWSSTAERLCAAGVATTCDRTAAVALVTCASLLRRSTSPPASSERDLALRCAVAQNVYSCTAWLSWMRVRYAHAPPPSMPSDWPTRCVALSHSVALPELREHALRALHEAHELRARAQTAVDVDLELGASLQDAGPVESSLLHAAVYSRETLSAGTRRAARTRLKEISTLLHSEHRMRQRRGSARVVLLLQSVKLFESEFVDGGAATGVLEPVFADESMASEASRALVDDLLALCEIALVSSNVRTQREVARALSLTPCGDRPVVLGVFRTLMLGDVAHSAAATEDLCAFATTVLQMRDPVTLMPVLVTLDKCLSASDALRPNGGDVRVHMSALRAELASVGADERGAVRSLARSSAAALCARLEGM